MKKELKYFTVQEIADRWGISTIEATLTVLGKLNISVFPNPDIDYGDRKIEYEDWVVYEDALEAYEKLHPEILKKPEPKTTKEPIPPYLDGNNPNFAPELALAIRLWEKIASGEFDSKKENLEGFVENYLKKELPGIKITRAMKTRFSTMVSSKPDSLTKGHGNRIIEAVKKRFTSCKDINH